MRLLSKLTFFNISGSELLAFHTSDTLKISSSQMVFCWSCIYDFVFYREEAVGGGGGREGRCVGGGGNGNDTLKM